MAININKTEQQRKPMAPRGRTVVVMFRRDASEEEIWDWLRDNKFRGTLVSALSKRYAVDVPHASLSNCEAAFAAEIVDVVYDDKGRS